MVTMGCWTWDSENTVIQFNESHHNMTPLTNSTARDGAGFDLDLGTENGIIQYNWSHDNQGEGYLFVSWPVGYGYSRGVSHNAQMRYNLSERDGKKARSGKARSHARKAFGHRLRRTEAATNGARCGSPLAQSRLCG